VSFLIRVLGPVDIVASSGARSVGGRQPQMLLGALVLGLGHSVSTAQLVDVLWGGDQPEHAEADVLSYVSRLRKLVGADRIERLDGSYVLHAGAHEVDALQFESLVRSARDETDPTRVRSACREALRLWRGPAFGELSNEDPFRLEAVRLEELRILAMELQLEAELTLGHSDLVVGELEAAVQEYPYRERLWYLLIDALARDGRRVEALRACRDLRRVLGEVGLDPGPQLEAIEDRILAGDVLGSTESGSAPLH
jgi:DNA-binding SARP family transcriptional activator